MRFNALGQLVTYGLFWTLIVNQIGFSIVLSYSWNLLFSISFCYYSKQLLKVENNRLQSYINFNYCISSRVIFKSLRIFDEIHQKITEFNQIWSRFLFISIFGIKGVIVVLASQALSSKMPNIYIRFCYLFFVGVMVVFVLQIVIICSSVESEAKRSHKLLTKLNARSVLKISLRIRIKVCIELNSKNIFSIIYFSIH